MEKDTSLVKFPPRKDSLLQILHHIQDNHPNQYLSEDCLKATAKYLDLPLSSVYGVAEYYSMFSLKPRGRYIIRICTSPVCGMMGSTPLVEWLKNRLSIGVGETTPDGLFTLEEAECLGRCGKAPSMIINRDFYGNLTEDVLEGIISNLSNP
ncbi:MAG: NAD(P)H-dependent oxidoreductase subunit E [Bacteroidales bacterium]|nr:NAD(P)H-dependent oxidoreductase subunit E [Bacteroidales bacterium]MBN2747948.1 NAD(P)H-dependent oxidoreductase subunit E [Bacteroidales bacterium]